MIRPAPAWEVPRVIAHRCGGALAPEITLAGLPIAAALAFVAAFLNAVFGLCLGCQLYLLLQRAGIVGRAATA